MNYEFVAIDLLSPAQWRDLARISQLVEDAAALASLVGEQGMLRVVG